MGTTLGLIGLPATRAAAIPDKAIEGLPPFGTRIAEFDTWRPGYAGASILVVREGTTEHAPLYSDFGLTVPISNPVVLLSYTDENGTTYGKWPQPVYTYVSYYLTINETAPTGIIRIPIYDMDGENVSLATVASERGGRLRRIQEVLDDVIYAEAFGSMAESQGAEAITTTLEAAIGAAAAQGGGEVILPSGRILFTELTLPQSVVLRGQGRGATTLTSSFGAAAITLGGDGAGLRHLTLDGINQATGSTGVYGVGTAAPVLEDVLIKRFHKGWVQRGLTAAYPTNLTISDCVEGVDLRGDTDPTATGTGGVIRNVRWQGGGINLCTTAGFQATFFDSVTEGIVLADLQITDNIGNAILLNGARNLRIEGGLVRTSEAQTTLRIQDDANLALRADNTTDHLTFDGVIFDGGTMMFNGTCASVEFARSDFRGVSFNMSVPEEPIVLRDCIEDADTSTTGDTTKLVRVYSTDDQTAIGNTADNVPTVAWSQTMEPGQFGYYVAEVVAQQQDGTKGGFFHIACGAYRPGAELDFNLQTDNFTAGATVSGGTSGATARIIAVTQSAGSGTLTLGDISGTFVTGEVLTDDEGGNARADGVISTSDAVLDGGGSTALRADALIASAAYDAYWAVSGAKMRLVVVGATSEAVQWTCRVRPLET